MGMEATSLFPYVKGYGGKRLIVRGRNPEDGRGVLIHLTDYDKEMRDFSKKTVKTFDNDQIRNFRKIKYIPRGTIRSTI
jgi:DNA-binding MarR family transcriptional regulator